ncbi:restriction endonuclease [Streptomyces sp. Isolate_219]|uniref:restriction endonuclease n=1 Tax=Streptomyces sp. Isolate_219 TaxID=2950110 RepID=UPI0021C875D4|nr:restriction endonuclease [Streptomyces sp. Isolate_219]MCR8578529.1 restriction endonuclease [Streptomyces sp. Isolate_219]
MAAPARRRSAATRRPTRPKRRPRGKAARRRAREGKALTALLIGAFVVAAVSAYPVVSTIVIVLAAAAALTIYLSRTGRLRLPAGIAGAAGVGPRRDLTHTIAAYQAMGYTEFEHAVADLARRDPAVRKTDVSGGKNDRGLDVLVHLHSGDRYLLQCKRWKGRVGSEEVMKINGTYRDIHDCVGAAIITTSAFTADAERTNAMLPKALRLIDGRGLARWASGGRPPWA